MNSSSERDWKDGDHLGRKQFAFISLMLLLTLVIESIGRVLHGQHMIGGLARDAIGVLTFIPLSLGMLVVHRYIRYASFARAMFVLAIVLLFLAQITDVHFSLKAIPWLAWAAPIVAIVDDIFYVTGSVMLLAASYTALIEAETGHKLLARKRELLKEEIEERELAEEESRRARAQLATRVRERTAELAERNQQLAEQLAEGERVRAELEESQRLLRDMARIARCGAWEIDVVSERVEGTEECRRLCEFELDEPITIRDVIPCFTAESLKTVTEIRRHAEEQGTSWDVELPFIGKKGTRRWVRTIGHAVRDADGKVIQLAGTVQDITARKSAEFALHESENLLHAVITSAPIFLWALDLEGRITLNTGLGLTRLGLPMGRNVGMSVFELYPNHPQIGRIARRAIAGEHCSEVIDNNGILLHATYSPLYDGNGKLAGAIGVAIDVTRERTFEARIRQKQKMEAIGALAGGIAHDFNNILYAMDGFAALAEKEAAGLPSAVQCIGELRTAGARAMELVDRILAFSRQDEPRKLSVDLGEEIRNTATLVESTLPRDISLELDIDPESPPLLADPAQIQQVLLNLCTNARYAMREHGGVIVVRTRARTLTTQDVAGPEGLTPGSYIEMSVSDTGSGIDPRILSKMFDPFFTTKPAGQGTGLGLAIVHSIVQSHGGAVKVESKPGQGTTIRVLLATESTNIPHEAIPETRILQAGYGPSRRVAVIDDEPQIRIFLRMLLEDAGHLPACYRSGGEALTAFASTEFPVDIVLVDLVMPEMDGIELTRALKQSHPTLPILLCTGHVEAEFSSEVRALEIAAFVKKPINPEALLQLIARVTARAAEVSAT